MRKVFLAFTLLFASTTIFAQANDDSLRRVIQKEDVIVTTTRAPERTVEVPAAISSVPIEDFKDSRGYELKDALWNVPGVLAQSRGGHSDLRVTMRGFGARGAGDRSNAGNMRGVRVLIDGIPETEPDGRTVLDNVDLFNVNRLEVLRSNASTLYGSASGGVISLFTQEGFPYSFLETRNNFGSFGLMKNSLMAGARTGSTTIFTSYSKTQYDGYRVHSNSAADNFYMNISSQLDPKTHLRVTAAAAFNEFRFPGALTWEEFEADPTQANPEYITRDERRDDRVGRLGFTLDRDFGAEHRLSGTFYFQPRFITRSERGTYRDFTRLGVGSSGQYSWNTLFGETQSSLIAGFDQSYQDGAVLFYDLKADASRGALTENQTEPALNSGFYLQEELKFGDLHVMIGGRYDMATYRSDDLLDTLPEASKSFTRFTPKASIGYMLGPNNSVYVLYGGGVENPAFNEINPPDSLVNATGGAVRFNPLLEPVISTTYEAGAKGSIVFGNGEYGLRYDVAAFMIKIQNDLIPWDGGRFYHTAGETSRNGFELGLGAFSDFGLSLQTALTFMSSIYDKYSNNLGTYDGNQTAGIPGMFGNARLRYDHEFSGTIGAFIEGGVEFVGEYYADDRNDKLPDGSPDPSTNSLVPSYSLVSATLGFHANVDRWNINVFAAGANLGDKSYIASAFINGANNRYFEPGLGSNLTAGIGVKYSFKD